MSVIKRPLALVVGLALAVTLAACSTPTEPSEDAPDYPTESLDFIIPFAPGGATDPMGREFAELLSAEVGQPVPVENLPGGDTTLGMTQLVDSPADGYTIGLGVPAGLIVQPQTNPDLTYTPDDVTIVAKLAETPNAILVRDESPYQTLDDLLDDARSRPNEVRLATTGQLNPTTFVAVALGDQAEVKLSVIPYSGGGEASLAVLSGEVEAVVAAASGQLGQIEAGELRALAYTGTEDAYGDYLPGAVALEDDGYDIPFPQDYLIVAPAGLPDDVDQRLYDLAFSIIDGAEWKEWAAAQGLVTNAMTRDEIADWFDQAWEATERVLKTIDEG